jgi:hypothetical protein
MLGEYWTKLQSAVLALVLCAMLPASAWAATPDGLTPGQVAALEQRVRARWQALSATDYDKAWEYSTPVYRGIFPKELYVLGFSYAVERELTGVEVVDYDAAAAVASVTARVMSKPLKQTSTASRAVGAVPLNVHEKWMLIDGEWWYSASS